MRFATTSAIFLAITVAACEPAPQPQPDEMDAVVDATRTDVAVPSNMAVNDSADNAAGNMSADMGQQGQSPAAVVERFANLLVDGRFDEAHQL